MIKPCHRSDHGYGPCQTPSPHPSSTPSPSPSVHVTPSPQLPLTGTHTSNLTGIALVLVLIGAALIAISLRRRGR